MTEELFDFGAEEDQKEGNFGPVPAGSYVIVKTELQSDKNTGSRVFVGRQSGLKQLNFKFTVVKGKYEGCFWYQRYSLPLGLQNAASLNEGQRKSCTISGAVLKAMLQVSGKPTKSPVSALNGLVIPVKVRLGNTPREKDGKEYWSNEVALVVTQDKAEFAQLKQHGEIINPDGDVVGKRKEGTKPIANTATSAQYQQIVNSAFGSEDNTDQIPF